MQLIQPTPLPHDLYRLKITFISELLGSQPPRDVATAYMARRIAEAGGPAEGVPEDELAMLRDEQERGVTVFHSEVIDNVRRYFLMDYQVRGFLKDTALNFNGLNDVKALRSKVANYVMVHPRRIELQGIPPDYQIEYCERQVRWPSATGPRVALAKSEQLPSGTWFTCDLMVYKAGRITGAMLASLLSYGQEQGIGQWRGASRGRFTAELYHLESVGEAPPDKPKKKGKADEPEPESDAA